MLPLLVELDRVLRLFGGCRTSIGVASKREDWIEDEPQKEQTECE
jgi:hypothetical protein